MTLDRRSRWAISFADLSLLLLGFFVLLQASGQRSRAVLAGVGAQFGAKAIQTGSELRAADLFLPGEAVLSPGGRARLQVIARRHSATDEALELASSGQDAATERFDGWDLAAARLGAVARTLKGAGIAEHRLVIRGLDQQANDGGGQVIRVAPTRRQPR